MRSNRRPAPTLSAISPASPANENSPKLQGSAAAGSTLRLYPSADCSGPALASGSAAELEGEGISVAVPDDSTTTIHATATSAAGNTSGCSGSVTYTEDSSAPETTIDSGPSGSTSNPTPTFSFHSSEAGSAFECSLDSGVPSFGPCSGPGAAHTPTANLSDGPYTFRVRATDAAQNTDPTPATQAFEVETAAPPAPTLSAISPASPANENSPKLQGSAAAGSTLRLYTSADCSGPALASGSAAELEGEGISVAVPDDSTTTIHATATSAAGNTSGCSASSVTYTEDSSAPETTIDSGPQGLTNDPTPTFGFSASEADSAFECRFDSGAFAPCRGPQSYRDRILSLNPALYWPLDDAAAPIRDVSGNGHDGSITGDVSFRQDGLAADSDGKSALISSDGNTIVSGITAPGYGPYVKGSQRTFECWLRMPQRVLWVFRRSSPDVGWLLSAARSSAQATRRRSRSRPPETIT